MNIQVILIWIRQNAIFIEVIANAIVILGAIPVFYWLKDKRFKSMQSEIAINLKIRKNIKEKLREHADSYDRSQPHDIGIRLVHWKNYPWKLEDDGYKQSLYYDTNLGPDFYHGTEFLSNTGILVEDHIWFLSRSLYLGKFGMYMIEKPGLIIPGFAEVNQRIKLVSTLKYKYIVNWDFEELIEYEPVFYTKLKYTNKKLFENELFALNYANDGLVRGLYFRQDLDRRKRIKDPESFRYLYYLLKGHIQIWKQKRQMTRYMRR